MLMNEHAQDCAIKERHSLCLSFSFETLGLSSLSEALEDFLFFQLFFNAQKELTWCG